MTKRPGWNYWNVSELIKNGSLYIGDGYRAKNAEMSDMGLPFARAGNINNGFHFAEADILSTESVKKAEAAGKLSAPGDVTFTSKGTFGRFAFVCNRTPRFVYSPQLCYWRVKERGLIDQRFLFYWMQGEDCMNQLVQVKGLTDMADYVSLTNQRKMWLSAPCLPTQRKIAGILSAYDDLIENNLRRIKILEEMAQNLYREWFVKFRFPGHLQARFLDSPLGRIPEGWEVRKVGEILDKVSRKKKIKKKDYAAKGAVPVVDQGRDFIGGYTDDLEAMITQPIPLIVFGDHTRILKFIDFPFACGADGTQLLRANTARMPVSFFFYALSSIDLSDFAYARHFKFLKEQEIVVPDKAVARLFTDFSDPIKDRTRSLRNNSEILRRTRDILLPKLISGDVNVSDLDIAVPEEA